MAPRKTIGFYLASAWIAVVVFVSVFGEALPLPSLDEYDFENASAGLFSGRNILGTDLDGVDILAGIVPDEDLSALRDEVPFREQIELDSMDFLDIVMELRKMYRIQIPEEDYPNLNTMAGTVSYLLPRLKDVPVSA